MERRGRRTGERSTRFFVVASGLLYFFTVAASALARYLTASEMDRGEWLTVGLPLLFLLLGQPLLGTLLGARLFRERPSPPWLRTCAVGLAALWLAPVAAEALRYGIVLLAIDEPTRSQAESWMWLLLSAPISAAFFAGASVAAQVTTRSWVAAAAGFWGTTALLLGGLGFNPDIDTGPGVLLLGGLIALLFATSAFLNASPSRGIAVRLLLPFAIALPIALSTAGFWQFDAYREEKEELIRLRSRLSAELENCEVTAARLDEFRREFERKEELRASLRLAVPEALEAEAFLEELERLAGVASVRLGSSRIETETFDFYEAAAIELDIEGDEEGVARLEKSVLELPRLARWQRSPSEGTTTLVRVTIVAMERESLEYESPCSREWSTGVTWFPPFVERLDDERKELTRLCERLSRLEPIHRKVADYRALLAEIEELQAVVSR